MSMEKKLVYLEWYDLLIKSVRNICLNCTDPVKDEAIVNYDNPLNCECRCERINDIISKIEDIQADIKKLSID